MNTPRRPWVPAGVRAAAVLAALFACAPRVRAEDPPPAPAPAPAPAPEARKADDVTVKLLEAGAEPRSPLRLKAPKGIREQAKMTMSMKTKSQGEEAGAQSIGMELTAEVKEVLAGGDREYELVLGAMTMDMGLDAAEAKSMIDGMLESVKGTRISARMTERGRQSDVKVTLPEGIDPMVSETMKKSLEQMNELGVRFLPEEAVGVGARWEIKDHQPMDGMSIDQTIVFTLKSREKDRLALGVAITQGANAQKIENEALPGIEMELVSLTSKGTGSMDYDLTRLLPVKASIAVAMSMEMRVGGGPGVESQDVKMEMSLEVGISTELAPTTPTPAKPDPK